VTLDPNNSKSPCGLGIINVDNGREQPEKNNNNNR
jgi:hypothetical protein